MSYNDMTAESRQLIDRLIPQYKSELRENFVKRLQRACGGMRGGIFGSLCNEVNALNASYQQVQRTLEQYGNNYEALAHQIVHVLPGVYPNPGPASWSRLSPRVYARVTGGHIWQETSTLEIRVLPQSGGRAANGGPQAFWHNVSYSLIGDSDPIQNAYNNPADVPLGAIIAYPDVGTGVQVLGPELLGGGGSPTIKSVSTVLPQANQTITISGTGFGTHAPYNGDSAYIQIDDLTHPWTAGHTSSPVWNWITLNVSSWTDSRIVLSGFTGRYGTPGTNWTLQPGDQVRFQVWNAQTGAGPASDTVTVATSSVCQAAPTSPFTSGTIGLGTIPLGPGELSMIALPNYGASLYNLGNFVVAVQVRDCGGNPLPGSPVTLSISPGSGQLGATSLTTDKYGMAHTSLTQIPTSQFVAGSSSVCSQETTSTQGCGYTTLSTSPITVAAEASGITARVQIKSTNTLVSTPAGFTSSSWWSAVDAPIAFGVGYAQGFAAASNPQTPLESVCKAVAASALATTGVDCAITAGAAASCLLGATCPVDIVMAASHAVGCAHGLLDALGVRTLPTPTTASGALEAGATLLCDATAPSQILISASNQGMNPSRVVVVKAVGQSGKQVPAFVLLRLVGDGAGTVDRPTCVSSGSQSCSGSLSISPQLFKIDQGGTAVEWEPPASDQNGSAILIASLGADGTTAMPGSACYAFGPKNPATSICPPSSMAVSATSPSLTGGLITSSPTAGNPPSQTITPGGISVKPQARQSLANTPQPTVTLTVQPGAVEPGGRIVVSGTVKDAGGAPVSGAKVDLAASQGGTQAPPVAVTAGNDGSFQLPFSAPSTPGDVVIRARLAGVANSPAVTTVLHVVPKAPPHAQLQLPRSRLPANPVTIRATIQGGGTSLQLPAGRLYIYGMVTGGAAPSNPFAIGQYAQVMDAAGQLSAALAYGTSGSNSYTTATGYHLIGGASVTGSWNSFKAYYGSSSRRGASSSTVSFSLSKDSQVVVFALASSQQSVTLSGIPGLQMDAASSGPGASLGMLIGHANLGPGSYTVEEQSAALAAGQDPDHMADLVGVFVFQ